MPDWLREILKEPVEFPTYNGTLILEGKGLKLSFRHKKGGEPVPVFMPDEALFGEASTVKTKRGGFEIDYPEYSVEIMPMYKVISVKIFPKFGDHAINWPYVPKNKGLLAYVIPEGEGVYVPVGDKKISKILEGATFEHTHTLPFFGLIYENFSVTYLMGAPYRTTFSFRGSEKGMSVRHDFRQKDDRIFYETFFIFSDGGIMEPTVMFREHLRRENLYGHFRQKDPYGKLDGLKGAPHIYLWGDGRTEAALKELKRIGINKAWIGYEEVWNKNNMDPASKTEYVTPELIGKAKEFGYLISPRDNYEIMESPEYADSFSTYFPNFYPKGCSIDRNGKIVKGPRGKGCRVSMKALEEAENFILKERFEKFQQDGVNSYMVTGYGPLDGLDDYAPGRETTIFEDVDIRSDQLKTLFRMDYTTIFGTEEAGAYAARYASFSQGNSCILLKKHEALVSDKKIYGDAKPVRRPSIFFKTLKADPDYSIRYDPRYRIPMYQAVFHDSLVSTDRMDTPLIKFPNLYKDRILTEYLYGVPSMWHLDLMAIEEYRPILKDIAEKFTPFHEKVAGKVLNSFEYLTEDRLVQKTVFNSGGVWVIANFRNETYDDIPPKSLRIRERKTKEQEVGVRNPLEEIKYYIITPVDFPEE